MTARSRLLTAMAASDGVSVSMGLTGTGSMQLGMKTTVNGDTYTMTYDSGETECTKAALPKCPDADALRP